MNSGCEWGKRGGCGLIMALQGRKLSGSLVWGKVGWEVLTL